MKNLYLALAGLIMMAVSASGQTTITPLTASGSFIVCVGETATLYGSPTGGTWSTSPVTVATISPTGVVTGVTAGTASVTYADPGGGTATAIMTVNPAATPIFGYPTLCVGSITTLGCATPGGTWVSDPITVATVAGSGIVTGITAGTANITYVTPAGCIPTLQVTVNTPPGTIAGSGTVCVGATTTLSCGPGPGTWISAFYTTATIDSITGAVTGVSPGTTTIYYESLTTGCFSSRVVTVNASPAPITGPDSICIGIGTTLGCATPGGTWMSSAPSVASIVLSTGIVTGNAAGTATISYTIGSGCVSTKSIFVRIPATISGASSICIGGTASLSSSIAGGTWSCSATTIATVDISSGVVTGIGAGFAPITYTDLAGCPRPYNLWVTSSLGPGPITGPSTVCEGSTIMLSCTPTGGTWMSSAGTGLAVIGSSTGIVTGATAGTALISYVAGSAGCYSLKTITVNSLPGALTGASATCVGTTTTLSATPTGGTWGGGSAGIATIGSATGIVTGIGAGTAVFTYTTPTGCFSTVVFTVNATPAITGTTGFCVGGTTTLSSGIVGGTWSSASPVITVGSTTGIVSATAAGTVTITYALSSGCYGTIVVTASTTPAISLSPLVAVSCSPLYKIAGFGATTYSWAPGGTTPGVTSDTAYLYPDGTTYTVTGTTAGCSGTATFTATVPDRILGHLSFSGPAPSGTSAKVWLIQFNPSDSSITAQDSMLTCLDGDNPYYQFDGVAAGSYLVKAKLTSSVAGSSDYLPTYGASAPTWNVATPVTHASASDSLHIAMLYGTVPSGPGFIGGYVYMGAGKGTSGDVPVAHMIVYLKSASGTVLTYTYTDGSGNYSFSGLAYGSYVIYPEEMSYYTTPSAVITLSAGTPSAGPIGFKKRTTVGTIEPWTLPNAVGYLTNTTVALYPNPANDMVVIANVAGMRVTITDMTGREVYVTAVAQAQQTINIAGLANGVYMVVANGNGQVQRFRLVKE